MCGLMVCLQFFSSRPVAMDIWKKVWASMNRHDTTDSTDRYTTLPTEEEEEEEEVE